VVVPAYNEELRILPTLDKLHAFLSTQQLRYEIIVVDDGSKDRTVQVVSLKMSTSPGYARAPVAQPRQGRGRCGAGMLAARGQIRVMCDATARCRPSSFQSCSRDHRVRAEIAKSLALRRRREDRREAAVLPVLWSRLANRIIQRSLVPGVRDTQCGFKAFTAEAARNLFRYARIDGWRSDLEILALARRRGFGIEEVGVEWMDDRRSRVNPLTDMWKVIREALTIRRNLRRCVYNHPLPA